MTRYKDFAEVVKNYEASTGEPATPAAKQILAYFWDNRNNPEKTKPLFDALTRETRA